MAASTTVTVLTPNGRRQTVKVSPNTPLLQVLEDVCKKHGINPDDHGLKFQRNVLDLTLQWRFASLPNNAKLEVVPSTRKQAGPDSPVRIALQMEDSSRLQGSFSSGQTLWELLTNFPQTRMSDLPESGSTPVCVYMRDEVSGEEALKKTTLKSLGLTGGSAIVRFLNKKTKTPDDGEPMEAVTTATDPVAKETPPHHSLTSEALPSQLEAAAAPSIKKIVPDRTVETLPLPVPDPSDNNTLPVKQEVEGVPDSQNAVRPKSTSIGDNREEGEKDGEKAGPSGLNSTYLSTSSAPFVPFSGGGQRLGGPGVSRGGPSSSSSSSLATMAGGPPKAKKAKPSHDNTKRQDSAKQEDWEGEEFLEPVDRDPLIYHMDSGIHRHGGDHDLPDEFFEVTVDDIRKRFAQLKSERRGLEEAPLMTKALRESQMKDKMGRYPRVVLRIQFPDRRVLQGFFRPLETVATLRHFVKSHLEDPQLQFSLFIAPPKTILDDPTATLFQANLFPAAVVYFGADMKTDSYLQRELLDSSVSALQADEAIAGCMPRSPASSCPSLGTEEATPPPPGADPPEGTRGGVEDDTHSQAPKPVRTDPGKVPKWLKLPGKK